MKKIFCLFLISISLHAAAQNETVKPQSLTPIQIKLKHARHLNTAGWLIAGTGAICLTIGFATYPYVGWLTTPELRKREKTAIGYFYTGTSLLVASLPVFLISKSKIKKAKLLTKSESVYFGDGLHSNLSISKIGITIDF